ncbi:ribbon-helix-helix domain-containing protein [Candidatus Woesearchaeota archaeon]|nr:ribbon-helix-helix domain-containing protein [Candidatus Woesearchaeota archaeon]
MNTQINVRFPEKLLTSARAFAETHGFGTVQEFVKETVREKLFEKKEISKKELILVKKLVKAAEKQNLYGTEKELMRKLKKR